MKAYNAAFPGGYDFVLNAPVGPGVYIPSFGPPFPYNSNQTPAANPARTTIGGNPDVTPYLQGNASPPLANEAGWKDTVIMYPGQVTRIAVRFAPTDTAPGTTAYYPFTPNDSNPNATAGTYSNYDYVWHCHIVDHEDNEMMRPYQVDSSAVPASFTRTYVQGDAY
jgi:spore coat protein A